MALQTDSLARNQVNPGLKWIRNDAVRTTCPAEILSLRCAWALQKVELKAEAIVHVGKVDAAAYPLAKKKTSYEFLREKAHLRPRTNTIGALPVLRSGHLALWSAISMPKPSQCDAEQGTSCGVQRTLEHVVAAMCIQMLQRLDGPPFLRA